MNQAKTDQTTNNYASVDKMLAKIIPSLNGTRKVTRLRFLITIVAAFYGMFLVFNVLSYIAIMVMKNYRFEEQKALRSLMMLVACYAFIFWSAPVLKNRIQGYFKQWALSLNAVSVAVSAAFISPFLIMTITDGVVNDVVGGVFRISMVISIVIFAIALVFDSAENQAVPDKTS